jgi:hypothetical protein
MDRHSINNSFVLDLKHFCFKRTPWNCQGLLSDSYLPIKMNQTVENTDVKRQENDLFIGKEIVQKRRYLMKL